MRACLITGYPGFLASRLVEAMMEQNLWDHYGLLVHPLQLETARKKVKHFSNVTLFASDITVEDLYLSDHHRVWMQEHVTHVFHLAALYDLAVPLKAATAVNVIGTEHINQLVRTLPRLERYVFFSTAYVSGERTGLILEEELDRGQSFKNHYEATKFAAEQRVSALSDVPYTIIRPGIVVGHSQTGETVKFDGPYFIMRFLDRVRSLPIPYIGTSQAFFNAVPEDYIIKATLCLAHAPEASQRAFHLTDPNPYKSKDFYLLICRELLGKEPTWTMSSTIMERALSFATIRKLFKVEREALHYFGCMTTYDASGAIAILEKYGITCPDFKDYAPKIVAYYKHHRKDRDKEISVT
ncbi:Male sterility domain-containing protein [Fictibacillus macauensis ZFHKF-1]|uniref:Male sterility domain-containing protein n=1 Tax=Fictibacillus macauensis ZFHKF-1 TaxID=1196324 RepID=I8IZ55_9BACL|nr:SDR family oxidoreductase [Fictibacillus macauensis]EIT84771.1 Male sterility domain-containing protein [Fictibacillus macauensis ZFHKF-1]